MTVTAEAQNLARNGQPAGDGTDRSTRSHRAPMWHEHLSDPVVVATDGSALSLRAVDWAAAEAKRRTAILRVVAVPALPPLAAHQRAVLDPPVAVADTVWADFKQFLDTAAARAAARHPGLAVSITLMFGQPGPALADGVQGASMLVIGPPSAAREAGTRKLGSVSDYVAGHVLVPVTIVRGTPAPIQGEIVAGVYGADHLSVLEFAAAEAASRGAQLRVLRVDGDEPQLDALLTGWHLNFPSLAVTQEIVHGAVGHALVRASMHADLVVTGQGARLDPSGQAGHVAHQLLRQAHCPVVIIPPAAQSAERRGSARRA